MVAGELVSACQQLACSIRVAQAHICSSPPLAVKSPNLLVNEVWHCKVTDFGLR